MKQNITANTCSSNTNDWMEECRRSKNDELFSNRTIHHDKIAVVQTKTTANEYLHTEKKEGRLVVVRVEVKVEVIGSKRE